jgi:hypothetical protein
MRPHVAVESQSLRLKERLQEAKISHNEESRVDLPGIRVTAFNRPFSLVRLVRPETARPVRGVVYFCTMGRIRVREVLKAGDGRPLPETAVLDGLEVTEAGTYDIVNALVQCNGKIRIVVDKESRVEHVRGTVAAIT